MKKRKIFVWIIMTLLLLMAATGCKDGTSNRIIEEEVWIDGGNGMWIRAVATVPKDCDADKLPLVTIGHGFRGNLNSTGADDLAQAFSEAGFATIRMDYAYYTKQDADARVNQYTMDTMIAFQIACIDYMIEHYHADPDRIGLYGRSLGGRVAMAMANENAGGYEYKALALVAPAGTEDALQYYMGGEDAWQKMKADAQQKGSVIHQKVILTPEFFTSIEDYTPSEHGISFNAPVLVIYNTEDYVVLPKTSKKCAAAYEMAEIVEVTSTESPHGYELGLKSSKLKDTLTEKMVIFFEETLKKTS